MAKAHLKVQRQREDFARKQANALVTSHDLIAYEDLCAVSALIRLLHMSKRLRVNAS
jgi:putative transposase